MDCMVGHWIICPSILLLCRSRRIQDAAYGLSLLAWFKGFHEFELPGDGFVTIMCRIGASDRLRIPYPCTIFARKRSIQK
jgi:hypothetical protein